ncbi:MULTISPECIES: phosphate-starvation-inducible PsiE family protein [Cyanophyceae]|uniref:phosphate-starvation-inducible PsiE family protein n=1 Tax=Cyanophyceae TaxID=3028117 RepID=UPI0016892224|nr:MULTISPECIES: phosphate-starvation-inducible PsiE family protein [Cyanophyceae]MBD1914972.1 phosphate-starvation-inducible PsiE family protein [Phormidium sp. FACHB-77]MBD2032759.1 phosphate-starvation-inducible PsiE family protein [Phormidium sp. FACHB-322]MBD2049904.1 phosphate-starvation-inducible PsiE family protein [Leptolyngbya sp. FACHB-60]
MANWAKRLIKQLENDTFLSRLHQFEGSISKVLSLGMVVVILAIVFDLVVVLIQAIFTTAPGAFLGQTVIDIFGLFLTVLIALEILENITAYIQKHVVQVELVIATALTAVGRKFIILDLTKVSGTTLIGLAIAIFALAISYWLVRVSHR